MAIGAHDQQVETLLIDNAGNGLVRDAGDDLAARLVATGLDQCLGVGETLLVLFAVLANDQDVTFEIGEELGATDMVLGPPS